MATISAVVDNYIVDGYLEDQGDYFNGPARITFTSSIAADVILRSTVNGGSIQWDECGTWETWLRNRWQPGIFDSVSLTASSTGVCTRSTSVSADLLSGASADPNAIWGPTVNPQMSFTSSSTGNCTFSSSASASTVFTVSAFGGKILAGTVSGDIVITASATGERKPGGTATAPITLTTDASGVVRLSAYASPQITLTATGTGNLTFFGVVNAPIDLGLIIQGGLVVPSPNDATTFQVKSETRIHLVELDQVNDDAGAHLGHEYFKIPFKDGETRVFTVLVDTREATIKSETREQPMEVH